MVVFKKFKSVSEANDILSDPEKREKYDKFGMDAFKEGGNGGMDPSDIFSSFFGGGFGGGERGPRKTKDKVTVLNLSLEELYAGVMKKMKVTRRVVCKDCTGTGSASKQSYQCKECKGTGMKVTLTQFGPGRYAQQRGPCDVCRGTGENVPEKDKCKGCHGEKVVEDSKVIKVEIDRGSKEGKRVTFKGESDELPGAQAGDLIFVVKEKPHGLFKRDGVHLYMEKELPLIDALTGTRFIITHLDGHKIVIQSNEIVKPGDLKEITNEGMPVPTRPYEHGNLYIKFSIKFPDKVTQDQATALQKCLGKPAHEPKPDGAEEIDLKPVDPTRLKQDHYEDRRSGEAYDEDEGQGGARSVQCAQQ